MISCKEESKKETPSFDFIKTFAGKIDNKYPLHIKLNSESGKINGTYFYDKVGTDIEIKGTILKDSTLTLNEFDQKGNQTGLWKGKLINKNKISGIWSKPNGDSAKDFNLILTSDNYQSSKKAISDSKFSNYNGTYNSPFNDGGISFGRLIIKYNENNEIEFDISTAHQAGCTGELKGTAKINSNGIATHSSSNCKSMSFEFKNNKVIVNEKNCDLHGMRCYFSGTYEK
jgi:hypothetical protein